jgi:hypothetical protein
LSNNWIPGVDGLHPAELTDTAFGGAGDFISDGGEFAGNQLFGVGEFAGDSLIGTGETLGAVVASPISGLLRPFTGGGGGGGGSSPPGQDQGGGGILGALLPIGAIVAVIGVIGAVAFAMTGDS